MLANTAFARRLRLRRLYHHEPTRLLVVPLDHSVTDGPITGGRHLNELIGTLSHNGVDAVVLHKGTVRYIDPAWFTHTSLIVHLSASTMHAPDPNAKYLVTSVEECLRLGADAVSVHVNLGSAMERYQIADLGAVAEACDRWNMPLLAMMYPRGPKIGNPRDPELLAHAISLAADLGADFVKTLCAESADEMADITGAAPVPVIVAGGQRNNDEDAVYAYVEHALRGGAAGAAIGRNIFQSADPGAMAARLAKLVHHSVPAPL